MEDYANDYKKAMEREKIQKEKVKKVEEEDIKKSLEKKISWSQWMKKKREQKAYEDKKDSGIKKVSMNQFENEAFIFNASFDNNFNSDNYFDEF